MATAISTARTALDRVPDAFAFFVRQVVWQRHLNNPCPPVLLWRQAASLTLSVTSSGTSAVVRNFWFIRLHGFLENRVFSSSSCPQTVKICLRFMLLNNSYEVGWVQTASVNLGSRHVHILALLSWFESVVSLFQHFVRLQVLSFLGHFSYLNNL